MLTRKETRELLMKILYQMDIRNEFDDFDYSESLSNVKRENEKEYFVRVIDCFKENRKEVDDKIQVAIKSRDINKIGKIELALIRLAATEIDYLEDIPVQVSVNESIELSKVYATDKSYKFINGVLGRYIENKEQVNG